MSFNVAMLEAMQAEGLDLDACIRVLKAGEKKSDPTAAERKRRQRAKSHRDVTRDMVSPNESNLTPSVTPQVISNEITPPADDLVLKPEHVVEVWNERAPTWGLAPIRKLTPQRRRKLQTRIRENSIDEFTEAISAIGRSPFLRGENGRGWRADFDWMLEPKNFTKLTEGTFDR